MIEPSSWYNVSATPKNHTAVVFEAGQSGASALYGHVAFVEKVNDDGSIIISESNVKGLGIVSYHITHLLQIGLLQIQLLYDF
jgi:surface antigen